MTVEQLIEELKEYSKDALITVSVCGESTDYPLINFNEETNTLDLGST